ncbi:unnamed protein product [Oikopleura dioica]|uniref:Uncharacterized protein n=1 Tax=Oikopleura dioica TaxID=34765 RepID=E4XHZ3_OIKDI|nr:unnamed protein product [Oikopleura dioica]
MEISEENSPPKAKRISRRGWIIGITTCCVAIGIGVGVGVGIGGGDTQVDDPIRKAANFGLESPYRYDCNEVSCTQLDEYVWRDNSDYRYEIVAEYDFSENSEFINPVKTFVLNMTSQHWLTTEHVTRTEWYHELVISVPYNMDRRVSEWGVMLIDGGSNRIDNILKNDSSPVVGTRVMAMETGTITACLRQVPNQPLYFENDPRMGESGRKEDDIIAWTWKHFLEHPDESDWVLRLPMTKAARLALDTIDDVFQKNKESMNLADVQKPVDNFLITGASKRGWTTWTLAAVDKRVKAQVPMVLDCLNMEEIFLEWFRNNGAWSFALAPYWDEGLTYYFDRPEFGLLADIVDPYKYRDRMTMPKYVMSATGDEFFAPDDSYFWFNDMKGPTYLGLLPNAEHGMIPIAGLSPATVPGRILGFYKAIIHNYELPTMDFVRQVDENGVASITLKTNKPPVRINAWWADTLNSTRRDFRWARVKQDRVDWPTNSKEDSKTLARTEQIPELADLFAKMSINFEQDLEEAVEPYRVSKEDIEFQPIVWHRAMVQPVFNEVNTFYYEIQQPADGFRAVMLEAAFQGIDNRALLTFSTEVMITPDMRPFDACQGDECYGYLL